jgi:hypothetical protein
MADLIKEQNESIGLAESSFRPVTSTTKYVVAGTDPPTDFAKPVHILLKEAVKARWSQVTSYPAVTDIRFSNTWFADYKDLEIVFLHSVDDRNINRRSTDWRYIPMATFVDIHIFARGASVDEEPPRLFRTRQALENVVELYKTQLIPHASVVLESSDYIPERDNTQNMWHWLYSCGVRYAKTMVAV